MSKNKPYLVTIILLSLTLTGLIYLRHERTAASLAIRLEDFPLDLGEWEGKELSISEETLEILETRDVLMREYANPQGEKVYLALVYSATNRGSFHPPEICYLGGGTELLNKGVEEIKIAEGKNPYVMQANRLLMKDNLGEQIAWYWFSAGGRITSNYYRQQLFIVWDGLKFGRRQSGGALVRVSTRAVDGNLESAEARGKNFIRELAPLLLDYFTDKRKL